MLVPGGQIKRVVMQDAAGALGNGTVVLTTDINEGSMTAITFQVTGTFSATVTWEGTIDGTNWVALRALNLNDGTESTTTTAAGIFRITCLGVAQVRARVSSYVSGNVTVTGVASA